MKHKLYSSIFLLSQCFFVQNAFGFGQIDAHQHVSLFQKGVDSFLIGRYDLCDNYWLPLAREGDPMASRNMGILFHKGLGVRKDIEEAELYYIIAAEAGVASAQLTLGLMYLKGNELPRDLGKAYKYLRAATDSGDETAQYNLGLMHEYGIGTPKNKDQAWRLYNEAARGGHRLAALKIGGASHNTPEHPNQYIPKKVADAGADISFLQSEDDYDNYAKKKHLTADKKKKIYNALEEKTDPQKIQFSKELQSDIPDMFLKESNKQQNYTAQTPLSKNPFDVTVKDRVSKNENGEIELFSLDENNKDRAFVEAERYYIKAQKALMDNKKVQANIFFKQAHHIWQQLFEQGSGEAAYHLGKMYQNGEGRTKDITQSYIYFKKGQYYGNPKAATALNAIKARLSDSELAALERKTM